MEDELQDPYEYEVDLRDYIKVIWDQKWLILAIFLAAVTLAGFYSVRQPSIYETDVTLLITPRVSEQIIQGGEGGLTSVSLPPLAYERSALAADLVEQIITDLGLENDEGDPVSVASLKSRMDVNLEEKERETSQGSTVKIPLITVTVRGHDPERLKKVTNKWAVLFQERITELFASERARSFEFISQRFSEVQKELKELEQDKLEYKKDHSTQVLKNEVKVLKRTHSNFLSRIENQKATLREKRARLESLAETLAEEPKFLEPARSIPSENLWSLLQNMGIEADSEPGEGVESGKLKAFAEFKVLDQQVNDTYVKLNQEEARVQADIASLEEEVSYLESKLTEFEEKINKTQAKIDEAELQLKRFEREISRLDDTYDTLSSNLEETRIAKEEKETSTRIVEKAVVPGRSLSRDTRQNVAVAGVLGLFIGVLVAFFRNYMEEYEEGEEDHEDENEGEE